MLVVMLCNYTGLCFVLIYWLLWIVWFVNFVVFVVFVLLSWFAVCCFVLVLICLFLFCTCVGYFNWIGCWWCECLTCVVLLDCFCLLGVLVCLFCVLLLLLCCLMCVLLICFRCFDVWVVLFIAFWIAVVC